MQIEHAKSETAMALLTHDKDWQDRITVPSEEYEKWMEDFRQRLELPLPTEAQLAHFIRVISDRCQVDFGNPAEAIAAQLASLNFAETLSAALCSPGRLPIPGPLRG